ncbi:MAG: hypothetical protein MK207_11800 [Saprospiraceae bacterium]|nr:hypothetical protein [Saprospiraceae bacterium]
MKKFNIIFVGILLSCFLVSFIDSNNLNTPQKRSNIALESIVEDPLPAHNSLDGDTLSFEQLNRYVTDEMIDPIMDCFEKKDPHLFMTKCYSRIVFRLSSNNISSTLYQDFDIKGSVIFIDCSVEMRIADVSVNYTNKTITVRESFRSKDQDYKIYLDDLCKYIAKNGIPK